MNKIIGMAGHVDHGKSSIVTLLTDEEMMRLPEEKKRNMTLDLGFGSFVLDDLQIGVIDVPGHEDFIRNMVAGMWSLDVVLLVVAADEGWMPMTQQHAKVAKALDLPVICVVNKSDLVTDEELIKQQDNIQQHLIAIFDSEIQIISISTKTHDGIEQLKQTLKNQLLQPSHKTQLSEVPYLYIDRVFTIKGHGLTITGSLQNGSLHQDTSLILYPKNKSLRCKSIQSYHQERSSVDSPTRVALNLKNVDYQDISRGDLLTTEAGSVFSTKSLIVHLENFEDIGTKNKYIECAVGTVCVMGFMIPIKGTSFVRIELDQEIPIFWRQKILLINYGGSTIFGSGSIFWIGTTTSKERQLIKDIDPNIITQNDITSFKQFQLQSFGYYKSDKDIVLDEQFLSKQKQLCLSLMNDTKYTLVDLSQLLKLPIHIVRLIVDNLYSGGELIQDKEFYHKAGTVDLSPSQQALLTQLQNEGDTGITEKLLTTIKNGKKDMVYLISINKAIFLGEGIFYSVEQYQKAKATLLKNKNIDDIITIAEARETLDLSRKYIIPILNAMEKENILQRSDSNRIVKKIN